MTSQAHDNDANARSTLAREDRASLRELHPEPDERTALLHDGYLDPDDPAVSPYNLFYVRFTRRVTSFFLFITLLLWTILLISLFVTPPGFNTRGSGFFDFSFTCLSVGNLLVSLLFFAAPSKAMRILAGVLAFVLLVDVIILVSVPHLRHEEGPVGIVAAVWTLAVSIWAILADRIVAKGKREEEVRLTGREETRRTLREWTLVFTATTILVVFILVSILLTGNIIIRARDASLPYPGTKYPVDGEKYHVHLFCTGPSYPDTPTLLLESPASHPAEHSLSPWALTSLNETLDRICYWDRPGYAFSDTAPSPHSAGLSATALSQVLAQAGESGPWVILAGGYGSIVARVFASMHEHDTAGLLLVDPLPESLLAERMGGAARGARVWMWSVLSPLGISRLYGAIFLGRNREDRIYGRSVGSSGKFLRARLQQTLVADSLTFNDAVASQTILERSSIPLVVVSGGAACDSDSRWCDGQKEATQATGNLLGWEVVKSVGIGKDVWENEDGGKVLKKWVKKLVRAI